MKHSTTVSGFTLIEVMISMALFALVAAGISSATMMTSRLAYGNIYENAAFMAVQGYAEQIKSISYAEIRSALNDPSQHSIPTQSLSVAQGKGSQLKMDDPLTFGTKVEKKILIDLEDDDGKTRERTMRLWVTPTGRDLTKTTDQWDSIEITLNFEWEVFQLGGLSKKEGVVRLVKTNVAEY